MQEGEEKNCCKKYPVLVDERNTPSPSTGLPRSRTIMEFVL
jgi:hypothetical protein